MGIVRALSINKIKIALEPIVSIASVKRYRVMRERRDAHRCAIGIQINKDPASLLVNVNKAILTAENNENLLRGNGLNRNL